MSDTPETDAEEIVMGRTECDRYVLASFARKLERERDEARKRGSNSPAFVISPQHNPPI